MIEKKVQFHSAFVPVGVTSVTWKSGWRRRNYRAPTPLTLWSHCPRRPGCCKSTKPQTMMPRRSVRRALNSTPFRCLIYKHTHILTLKTAASQTWKQLFVFIDRQDFELVYPHWWFWEKSIIIICPQSSGELCSFTGVKCSEPFVFTSLSMPCSCFRHYYKIVKVEHSWCWTQIIVSRSRFLSAHPRRLWSCCRSRAVFSWAFWPGSDTAVLRPFTQYLDWVIIQ